MIFDKESMLLDILTEDPYPELQLQINLKLYEVYRSKEIFEKDVEISFDLPCKFWNLREAYLPLLKQQLKTHNVLKIILSSQRDTTPSHIYYLGQSISEMTKNMCVGKRIQILTITLGKEDEQRII